MRSRCMTDNELLRHVWENDQPSYWCAAHTWAEIKNNLQRTVSLDELMSRLRTRSERLPSDLFALILVAVLASACFPAEAILMDDAVRRDTVIVHDTTVVICRYHDPRPECRRDDW
jgi:hypothetical protein